MHTVNALSITIFYRNNVYKRFLILRLSLSFLCLKLLLFIQLRNEQLILETQFSKTYYTIMYSLEVLLLCVFSCSYVVICMEKGYGKWRSVNVNKKRYTYIRFPAHFILIFCKFDKMRLQNTC